MTEYISRDAVINITAETGAWETQNRVRELPAADVQPVKHGKWILEKQPDGAPYCFHCSVCDVDFRKIYIRTKYDYCPDCGARMDGDTE